MLHQVDRQFWLLLLVKGSLNSLNLGWVRKRHAYVTQMLRQGRFLYIPGGV